MQKKKWKLKKPPVTFLFLSTYDANSLTHSVTKQLKNLSTLTFFTSLFLHIHSINAGVNGMKILRRLTNIFMMFILFLLLFYF